MSTEEQAAWSRRLVEPTRQLGSRQRGRLGQERRGRTSKAGTAPLQYCTRCCCRPDCHNKSLPYKSKHHKMGGYPSKQTEITKAENVHRETLNDHSFSVMNIHGASSVGGARLVVAVLLLACLGYGMARYRDYIKRVRHRAATTLDIIKPLCPA